MKLLILLSLFLIGCGKQTFYHNSDPRFDKYVDIFYDEALKRGIYLNRGSVPIVLADKLSSSGFVAECQIQKTLENKIHRQVLILRSYFESHQSDYYLEPLIMHELGHCVLNRDHTSEYSIMNDTGFDLWIIYLHDRDALLDELFLGR